MDGKAMWTVDGELTTDNEAFRISRLRLGKRF